VQGIDAHGLDGQDRRYMETIVRVFHGGPAGYDHLGLRQPTEAKDGQQRLFE
jgi:Holliday junction resolvasome RuvABC ATP-dependent DNA helicase subunit